MRITILILAITVSISSSAQRDTLHFVVSRPTEKNTELYAGQLIMLDDNNHYELDIIRTPIEKRKEASKGADSIVRSYILPPNPNDSNAFRFKCEPYYLGNGQLFLLTDYADKQTLKLPDFTGPFHFRPQDTLAYRPDEKWTESEADLSKFVFEGFCLVFNDNKTEGYLSYVKYLFAIPNGSSMVPVAFCNENSYKTELFTHDYKENLFMLNRCKKTDTLTYLEGDFRKAIDRNTELRKAGYGKHNLRDSLIENAVFPDLTGKWLKRFYDKNYQDYLMQSDRKPGKLNTPELIDPIFSQFRLDYAAVYADFYVGVTDRSTIAPAVIFDSIVITNDRFGKFSGSAFPYEVYRQAAGYHHASPEPEFRTVDAWLYGHYCNQKMAFRFTFLNEKLPDGSYSDRWIFKDIKLNKGYVMQE
ncbi:MAG TPA: hypothetical protein VK151_05065 [Fluviicola sp.]|nr:hypothetical protein [Fluviicola sp.]